MLYMLCYIGVKYHIVVTRKLNLFLRKSIKLLPPELLLLAQICTKSFFGWGFAADPTGGAYSAPPDPLAGLRGLLLRGGEGRERNGRGEEGSGGKREEGRGRGEEGKGREGRELPRAPHMLRPALSTHSPGSTSTHSPYLCNCVF